MRASQDIRPVTYLKTHPAELIRDISASRRPVVITQNGTASAVVVDIASWEKERALMAALKLIAQGEQDIRAGKHEAQETLLERLEKKYRS
jgi:prevent-host-death family protein